MGLTRRQVIQSFGASGIVTSLARTAHAQVESARILTGFPPGGTSDATCRRVAEKLNGTYAKSVVVENRTGAAGQIAITAMKSVAADGLVMLQTPMSMLGIYPHIYKKLPYDPVADLTPVSLLANFDFGFGIGPSVPSSVKTMNDYLAWCKANPSQANFASPAAGSTPHFIGVLLGRSAGVSLTHVPYRGSQPAILDMIGGQLPAVSAPIGEFLQHLPSGRVRVIGASGAQRSRFAPQVPTYTEQGFKDLAFREWFGMYLPAGASSDVVQKLNAAVVTAMAAPETVEGLAKMALEAASSTPMELAALLRADTARWGPLVKTIGFTVDG